MTIAMICVIIPTLNSKPQLKRLLVQLPEHVRVVVTDGGSVDGTLEVAACHKALICVGAPGRGIQLRSGVRWAFETPWLLVLHADSLLPDDFIKRVNLHIANHSDRAGYFDLRFDSPRLSARIIEILVRLRCSWFGLPYGDQGLLISNEHYKEIGGFENIPLFEDVALVRKIKKQRLRRLGAPLTTNAEKFELDGFFTRGWKNFRLLRRYLKGESPEGLAKDYA